MAVGVTSFMAAAKQGQPAGAGGAPAAGKKAGAIKALDAARLAKERHQQQQAAREERKRKVAEAMRQKQVGAVTKGGAPRRVASESCAFNAACLPSRIRAQSTLYGGIDAHCAALQVPASLALLLASPPRRARPPAVQRQ